MDAYARSYGHEPPENWILVVHPDDTTEFYTFDDPTAMWCCDYREVVRGVIRTEMSRT